MGDWRLTIEGVGGHGCGREAKDGEQVTRCGNQTCVDCLSILAVETLKPSGSIVVAKLEHWPVPGAAGSTRDKDPGPVDDLITGRRAGSFSR